MMFDPLMIVFVFGLVVGIILTYYVMKARTKSWLKQWKAEEKKRIRKDVAERSRASLKGKIGEQLAPILPIFNYEPSDARFIGSPVDYIIFEGLSNDDPTEIIFADVKVGKNARLTSLQRTLRDVVENGRVSWETIHMEDISEDLDY